MSIRTPADKAADLVVRMEQIDDIGYLLGRLAAITEQVEEHTIGADPAADNTIRVFEQIHIMTRRRFTRLATSATTHLSDIKDSWRRELLDGLLTQVVTSIGTEIPKTLTPETAGMFAHGYYQQKGAILNACVQMTRDEAQAAMEAAKAGVKQLVDGGMSESEAAIRLGVNRMTVRSALGK